MQLLLLPLLRRTAPVWSPVRSARRGRCCRRCGSRDGTRAEYDVAGCRSDDANGRECTFCCQAHGFIESNSLIKTLDAPGNGATYLAGINDLGQIVGTSANKLGENGFVYSNGAFNTVAVPGASVTEANGINNLGQVVGTFVDSSGHNDGFLDDHGKFTTLDVPGAVITHPTGINDFGEIVGFYQIGTATHGFVYQNGGYTTVDAPGADFTAIQAINDLGQIAGSYGDSSGEHGFMATPADQLSSFLGGSTNLIEDFIRVSAEELFGFPHAG